MCLDVEHCPSGTESGNQAALQCAGNLKKKHGILYTLGGCQYEWQYKYRTENHKYMPPTVGVATSYQRKCALVYGNLY